MTKPIFANTMHQIIVNDYLNLMLSFVKEISTKTKYQNFKEVLELIIEYHNSYGEDVSMGNWNDWLMGHSERSEAISWLKELSLLRWEMTIYAISPLP